MFDPSNSYGRSPYASSGFGGVRPNTRQLGRSPYDTVPAMHTQPWSPSGGPGYGTTQPWSPGPQLSPTMPPPPPPSTGGMITPRTPPMPSNGGVGAPYNPGYGTTQPWSPNTRQPSPTSNFFGYSPGGRGRGPGFGGGM